MLTLLEAAKLVQDPLKRGVIEIFPRVSPVLERLPFFNVNDQLYLAVRAYSAHTKKLTYINNTQAAYFHVVAYQLVAAPRQKIFLGAINMHHVVSDDAVAALDQFQRAF